MNGNITTAPLGGNRNIKTKPLFQYDYGQVLKIVGVTLPAAYEVHFSNQLHGVATTQIGNADGVIIPDIYLTTGEPVYAWVYLHTGTDDGETEYTITIPVVRRASISDAEPTPVQQDVITQAIAALNTAVEQTAQDVQDATEAKEDAEEAAGNAYESAVSAAQYATNAGASAGQAQSAQAASELAQQKAEEAQTGAQTAKWAAESAQTAAEAAQAGAVAARTGAETAQAWAVAARSGAEAAQHAAEAARDEITGLSATANTLPAGSQATASYSDGLLTIGVPKGEKGNTGDTGATPDFAIGTVSTLPAGSEATATITGTPEEPVLNLGIPKGDQGEVTQAEFDALADDVSDMQDTLEHKADINGYYTDMTVGNAEQLVSSQFVEDAEPYKFRTSGGSADIGNREYLDKVVGGTVAWNQQVRDEASENQTDYADVVTVTDAVVDDAAVKVKIEPVQDLHGQDSPWPAGGGKNLIDIPDTTLAADGSTGNISCVIPAGTYTFAVTTSTSVAWICRVRDADGNNIVTPASSASLQGRQSVTFTISQQAYFVNVYFNAATVATDFQIESGSTATSFAPYENLCPISGWDEVKVYDDQRYGGLVEWNQLVQNGNFADKSVWQEYSSTYDVSDNVATITQRVGTMAFIYQLIQCQINHKYYVSYDAFSADGLTFYLYWDARNVGAVVTSSNEWVSASTIFTGINNGVNLSVRPGDSTAVGTTWKIRNIQICDLTVLYGAGNEPSAVDEFKALFPASYYPYNAGETMTVGQVNGEAYRAYTIEMPTEAGTVYGGVLTVNKDGTGSLVVDRTSYTMNGNENWINVGGAYPQAFQLDTGIINADQKLGASRVVGISNLFKWTGQVTEETNGIRWQNVQDTDTNRGRLFVYDATHTSDLINFKQMLAETPLVIVYDLLAPLTFSLTASQVQTLLGTNNVWSDAGQIALTYTGTDEHLVLTTGRKYLTRISGTDSVVLGAGQEVTAAKGSDNVHDLTQMFGTAVADYVYQQGAGYFRKWFGGSHYAYNAGELLSVEGLQSKEVTGFNAWDEEWRNGYYANGVFTSDSGFVACKNPIRVISGTDYFFALLNGANNKTFYITHYDSNGQYIDTVEGVDRYGRIVKASNTVYRIPDGVGYIAFFMSSAYGTTYNHDICINLSHNASRNGEYQPYEKHSYPLDSTLTLRGIPKVDSNGVYWDGDEYGYDGAVKRRYGVVDLGTLNYSTNWGQGCYDVSGVISNANAIILKYSFAPNVNSQTIPDKTWTFSAARLFIKDSDYSSPAAFKAAMSGVYLVYELATSTDETAAPYQQIQQVNDWGTEEFASTSIVPVGHATRYPANLRDKLQHLPALASANGSYLITQTDGQMVLTPFPAPPTAAGNYLLKATVSGGNATYSWVAQ